LQNSIMMLSLSKTKFVALSEATKEAEFVVQILQSIKVEVELSMVVCVDKVGAIFIAENVTMSQCTKHINVCCHYISGFIEDGFSMIILVRTGQNTANVFTKNLSGDTYNRLFRKIEWDIKIVKE